MEGDVDQARTMGKGAKYFVSLSLAELSAQRDSQWFFSVTCKRRAAHPTCQHLSALVGVGTCQVCADARTWQTK